MPEVNLLKSYPSGKGTRYTRTYTIEQRLQARKFDRDFFDGTRDQGYGGYVYDGRWAPVAKDFIEYYRLPSHARILDIGAAKGFLLYELTKLLPRADVVGIDISEYCIRNAKEEIRDKMFVCDVAAMPFRDQEFDLVICINTVHNLPFEACLKAIRDIERIGRHKYIQVDAWRNAQEREAFRAWQICGGFYDEEGNWVPFGTAFSTHGWEKFFKLAGYTGEYYWTVIEDVVAETPCEPVRA